MKKSFNHLFPKEKPVIGMVHLKALPGAPDYGGRMGAVIDAALADACALQEGGVDGIMIENFFDAPFFKDRVGPETVAAMTRVIGLLRRETALPLGVNVLRNDGMSALAIAAACECQFVRVNQVAWAMLTDQGILEGRAAELTRYRRALGAEILIFADCLVKHAVPLAVQPMEMVARDTWERGGADALVISGAGTGMAADGADVVAARKGAPEAPLLIGSGITLDNLEIFLPISQGFLVGTWFKKEGKVSSPVDIERVRAFIQKRDALLRAA